MVHREQDTRTNNKLAEAVVPFCKYWRTELSAVCVIWSIKLMSSQKEYSRIILSERLLGGVNFGLIAQHTEQCLKKD